MLPLLIAVAGVVALGAGWSLMQRLGPRARIGRILASTPVVSVAEARALAGRSRYVAVRGRVDAETPFEDADHRPLVYRRTRIEAERRPGRWEPLEDGREVVPFQVNEGLDAIGVAGDELADGVVVVAREATGVAGDLGDRAPADLPATTPVRLRIEQVSSVDHAFVLGVPTADADGSIVLRSGLGRPVVLTTLERMEAIRLVGGGRSGRALVAAGTLLLGIVLLAVALLTAVAGTVLAVEATATPGAGGDPRSPGEGPGLVGDPLFAVGAVLLVGIAAMLATLAWVRATGGPRGDRPDR